MNFAATIRGFANKTGVRQDEILRKICLDAYDRVTLLSPVDTGAFRANWNVSIATPDLTASRERTTFNPAAAQAIVSELKWGQTLFITNDMPYAIPLERGSSRQAPAGVLNVAFLQTVGDVESVVRRA